MVRFQYTPHSLKIKMPMQKNPAESWLDFSILHTSSPILPRTDQIQEKRSPSGKRTFGEAGPSAR